MLVAVLTLADTGGVLAPLSIAFSLSAIVWRGLRKVIYLVPHPNVRISEVTLSEEDTAPQILPANAPSTAATGGASDSVDVSACAHNGGVENEMVQVDFVESQKTYI